MINSHSLAEYSSHVLDASDDAELDQRLGLYRVFLKLYEHHRGLLDEILDLENTGSRSRNRASSSYVQGVIQGQQVCLITNLIKGKSQSLLQPQKVWLIGRDRKAAFSIQDKRLSRRHAAIQYVENQGFYLIDLNSTNGSFVNGEVVRQAVLLCDGDQIRLGSLAFTFFICRMPKAVEALPSDLLEQINTVRSTATDDGPDPVAESISIEWDAPLLGNAAETFTFRRPSASVQPATIVPQLSASQQSDILDRFLKRQSPDSCN